MPVYDDEGVPPVESMVDDEDLSQQIFAQVKRMTEHRARTQAAEAEMEAELAALKERLKS